MKTFLVTEAYAAAKKTRLKLLEMGYRPIPTASKVAFMKGWPTMPVNQRTIESWPMMGPNNAPAVTTAIQLQGDMLAIDVDVSDAHVARQIEDLLIDELGEDMWGQLPIRDSGGAKFMVLLRTEKPVGMLKTVKYIDPEGNDHMVEFYGGASTRYFSCFGPHTIGKTVNGRREMLKEYRWAEGPSPLTVRPEDLPVISNAQFDAIFDAISFLLEDVAPKIGWEEVKNSISGEFEGGVVYDLTPEMTFDVHNWGQASYYEAIGIADHDRDARCSSSFIDGSSGNTSKCRMSVIGTMDEPALCIFDHETWKQHLPASWAPKTNEQRTNDLRRIGEALREIMPDEMEKAIQEAEEQGVDVTRFVDAVEMLIDNLAFNRITGAVHYLESRDVIWHHVKLATVKGYYAHLDLVWDGPKGGKRRYSPVDAWRAYDDKIKVDGPRFNPRTSDRIYNAGTRTFINGFYGLPPAAGQEPPHVDLLLDFLEHLVPDQEEREWLLDWMANKYQRPWTRNAAILFVAPGIQGAGRGTFFNILDKAFDGYTTTVSESDLLSARFNGYLENNLIVFCNEVGGMSWSARKAGYEALKDRVDPSHTMVSIERKGIETYRTESFASFMLATNNPDGLVMDAEDRRFAVITNGKPLGGELLEDMLEAGFDALAKAMRYVMVNRTVTRELEKAPSFAGKEEMLVANETSIDEAIRYVIDNAPEGKAWLRKDFEEEVRRAMGGMANVPGLRKAVTALVGQRAARMGAEAIPGKLKVGGVTHRVVAKNPTIFLALSMEERAEICGGSSPQNSASRIVPFPKP